MTSSASARGGIFDDDRIEAKYVNTPETPIYKKSTVLYGVDLAKKEIARRMQAVVVEGYTDVMACHLAGVETAIATCGTSFGEDHIRVLRRLLMDQNEFRGEVVFTFDGDSAGQKAALSARSRSTRSSRRRRSSPSSRPAADPCELRQAKGDIAVRDLIANRVPLFEFAIKASTRALRPRHPRGPHQRDPGGDGRRTQDPRRVAAHGLRAAARPAGSGCPTLTSWSCTPAAAPTRSAASAARSSRPTTPRCASNATRSRSCCRRRSWPTPRSTGSTARSSPHPPTPRSATPWPRQAGSRRPAAAARGGWRASRRRRPTTTYVAWPASSPSSRIPSDEAAQQRWAVEVLARLEELALTRTIADVKSRLQRINPVEQVGEYNRLFAELIALEARRRELRDRAIGTL